MTRFLSITLLSLCYILTAQADIYSASNALARGDFETAVAEFTKLAEKGDANAQANLGYMYYAGEGVPQDYEKAVYWYRKAAVQGNKDAQYNLAVSYAFGEGAKQDLTEAAIWYRRAGEQNHVVSQYSLGISYAYGEGVPQDQKEAARWFKKAADQGYARAQVNLGSMYHTGEGVEQDYTEAARWYRMAADRGDATAQYNLGAMYRLGKGLEQNYAQAKRWFRQSADQGYAAAQNELASLERSAAANVATRTIQTKPEIPPVEETAPEPTPTKKAEPIEEKVAVQNTETEEHAQTKNSEVNDSKKKPLFSVEKEGLLSLSESELDIAEPEPEPEAEEEIATHTEETTPVETIVEETEIAEVSESDESAIHNALGIPAPTDTSSADEEAESSDGFFSKLFTRTETEEVDTSITGTETVTETDEPVTDFEPAVVETPVKNQEENETEQIIDIAEEEIVTHTEETIPVETIVEETEIAEVSESDESAIHNALGLPAPTDTSSADEEAESSGGFFGKLFSRTETEEVDTSITETETVTETDNTEQIIDIAEEEVIGTAGKSTWDGADATIAEIEEATSEEVTASENSWADTATDTSETTDESESSGGLFSAIGDFFSGGDKEPESATSETEIERDDVLIAKMEEPAPVIEEIELAQEAETDLSQYSIDAGRRALTNNDYDKALEQFKPLAEAGNSEAQSYLGSLYYVGKGVSKDFNEAYNWYKKSADQGNMDAQYSVGNMYLLGEGVEQNNSDAEKWYLLASEQGHVAAKNNLASLKKLELLNHNNQLQLDTIAAEQKAKEEVTSEPVESTEEIAALDEEMTEPDAEAVIVEEKKPDLLDLLGGLFESNSSENQPAQDDDTAEIISESESAEVEIVELEQAETNITTYAAGEAPSAEPLQSLPNEEMAEESQDVSHSSEIIPIVENEEQSNNNIAALDDFKSSTSESPDFFKSLFGNDELEKANEADSVELESSEEITTINDDSVVSEEQMDVDVETEVGESNNESDEALVETTEESGGLFGFIGNIFSSENKDEIDNSKSENPEEIAMLEPEHEHEHEIEETSIDADEAIVEETIVITEIERLRPLATQGDQLAQYELGALYYSGNDVKQDYSQAALWYRRAAQQGNVDAQYSLGNMFLMGEGITQDDRQAAHWYALAAEQGHDSAKHNLENLQKTQASIPLEEIETITSNDQLVSLDDENMVEPAINSDINGKSEYEQGLAYAFGDGVAQNDRTAFNLFYESAEKGYALAQYKVGVAFAYGEGVRQDQKKAAEWYRKSAEQGYTIAQRNLALMYLDGKGVEQNKIQALAWYQVVANAGNAMDLRRRDMLKSELTDTELSESQELSKQISSRLTNPSL